MKTYLIKNAHGQYLRHQGHSHFWGSYGDAMHYSKRDVAEALALKYGGLVIER